MDLVIERFKCELLLVLRVCKFIKSVVLELLSWAMENILMTGLYS